MDSGKVLLINQPVAGHRAARRALYPLVQRLCEGGQMATVYATSAPGQARSVAEARGGDFARVICCGGDGTLNEVLDGLLRAGVRVPVGYVPTGTTNDLAHALRLPTKLSRAMELAVTGPVRDHGRGPSLREAALRLRGLLRRLCADGLRDAPAPEERAGAHGVFRLPPAGGLCAPAPGA